MVRFRDGTPLFAIVPLKLHVRHVPELVMQIYTMQITIMVVLMSRVNFSTLSTRKK